MKVYFLSSTPCRLTLNGLFYGIVDHFERFADLSLSDRIFIEFTPQGAHSLSFFFCEEILQTPPDGLEVYHLQDGVALYAKDFAPLDMTLRLIAQERFGSALVSLFAQGPIQLSLQTEEGFFLSTLPPSFAQATLSSHAGLYFIEGQNHLAIYNKWGNRVFFEEILSFSVENNILNAYLPLSDSLNRQAHCVYSLDENGCARTQFKLLQTHTRAGEIDLEKITEELLPYAFLECVRLGEDYASLLSESLQPSADKLREFLGDFLTVTLTKDPNVYGLVYTKGKGVFEVIPYTIAIEKGKITDVKC